MMSTYLRVDLLAFAVPFLFSFHPRLRYYRSWPALAPALLCTLLLFIPWDILFTKHGIWGFNLEHLAGPSLFGLPLEEWLFFICIPYACLFTFHSLRVLGVKGLNASWTNRITYVLAAASLLIAIFFPGRAYTAGAFGFLGVWLLVLRTWWNPRWLGSAYLTFAVLLVPFLAVDGILTGSGLHTPVVWYNNAQTLGVRLGTIPVEDIVYGLLMFLVIVTFHEALSSRLSRTAK